MRRAVPLVALIAIAFAGETSASVLCRTRTKKLVVRDACERREQAVTPGQQIDLGMQGPQGPLGPHSGELRLLDATGREVGLVTSLGDYGNVTVVGQLTGPGVTGSDFYLFSAGRVGLADSGSCNRPELQYFESSDCSGQAFANCNSVGCSSVSGAFLARTFIGQDASGACYVSDGADYRRGTFYRRDTVFAFTAAGVDARCLARGGTLLAPIVTCGTGAKSYCAPCCSLVPDVATSPVHGIDASVFGTPPFRLSR
jgi:hypothetical protein